MLDRHAAKTLSSGTSEEIRFVEQAKGAGEAEVPPQAVSITGPLPRGAGLMSAKYRIRGWLRLGR